MAKTLLQTAFDELETKLTQLFGADHVHDFQVEFDKLKALIDVDANEKAVPEKPKMDPGV